MDCKRFTARTAREALALVRQAFGEDAVVLSTKPSPGGVEVLAMAAESIGQIERMAESAPLVAQPTGAASAGSRQLGARGATSAADRAAERILDRAKPRSDTSTKPAAVEDDVDTLSMSTLSFQEYVRNRMLKKRQEALAETAKSSAPSAPNLSANAPANAGRTNMEVERSGVLEQRMASAVRNAGNLAARTALANPPQLGPMLADVPLGGSRIDATPLASHASAAQEEFAAQAAAQARRDQHDMMHELRQVKGLIEERFGALAFMEKLQRQPRQALLSARLLDCGFSPGLIRKLGDALPPDAGDEAAWAASVLERNLVTNETDGAIEDLGGVFALVGPTGVGKTTSTAKIAAAFASKFGAAHLGLITLDAYRVGAHEQLRAYGRILGVPVHTAHDRASLEDLLDLLSTKKMVLIDTAGMAQRDTRTKELLEMLSHRSIRRLLVLNAAAQGETIEDVLLAYRANTCAGVVLSKIDEAVKLGPALDAVIRHKLKVMGAANGQRVPEDWHRLSAQALIHRALRPLAGPSWKFDADDVNLVFAAPHEHVKGGHASTVY